MKNNFILLGLLATLTFASCKQDLTVEEDVTQQDLSDLESQQIKALGFSPQGAIKEDGEYIVEGDIRLTAENLKSKDATTAQFLRIGDEEQYRTTNLVTGLPRTIRVLVSGLPSAYAVATDVAIARYNAQPLTLKFQRITNGNFDIRIVAAPSGSSYLASAGFPSGGNPYNQVRVNSAYLGSAGTTTWNNYVGTILAHELGHCIGFRHTDYYNRAISCGGTASNEGSAGIGAILIPGTPSTATNAEASWMLACISANQNRPFNSADVIALNYLY